jgi:hypothetical protein
LNLPAVSARRAARRSAPASIRRLRSSSSSCWRRRRRRLGPRSTRKLATRSRKPAASSSHVGRGRGLLFLARAQEIRAIGYQASVPGNLRSMGHIWISEASGRFCMHRDLGPWDAMSVGMFLQTLLLALTERGLGSAGPDLRREGCGACKRAG